MLHHKINGCRLNARLACTSNLLKLIRKANDMKNKLNDIKEKHKNIIANDDDMEEIIKVSKKDQ